MDDFIFEPDRLLGVFITNINRHDFESFRKEVACA